MKKTDFNWNIYKKRLPVSLGQTPQQTEIRAFTVIQYTTMPLQKCLWNKLYLVWLTGRRSPLGCNENTSKPCCHKIKGSSNVTRLWDACLSFRFECTSDPLMMIRHTRAISLFLHLRNWFPFIWLGGWRLFSFQNQFCSFYSVVEIFSWTKWSKLEESFLLRSDEAALLLFTRGTAITNDILRQCEIMQVTGMHPEIPYKALRT